jgi:hypothetical protein
MLGRKLAEGLIPAGIVLLFAPTIPMCCLGSPLSSDSEEAVVSFRNTAESRSRCRLDTQAGLGTQAAACN